MRKFETNRKRKNRSAFFRARRNRILQKHSSSHAVPLLTSCSLLFSRFLSLFMFEKFILDVMLVGFPRVWSKLNLWERRGTRRRIKGRKELHFWGKKRGFELGFQLGLRVFESGMWCRDFIFWSYIWLYEDLFCGFLWSHKVDFCGSDICKLCLFW